MEVASFRHCGLRVWQDTPGVGLAVLGLLKRSSVAGCPVPVEQIYRCADAVPSDVAKGAARHTMVGFIRFLRIVRGALRSPIRNSPAPSVCGQTARWWGVALPRSSATFVTPTVH